MAEKKSSLLIKNGEDDYGKQCRRRYAEAYYQNVVVGYQVDTQYDQGYNQSN